MRPPVQYAGIPSGGSGIHYVNRTIWLAEGKDIKTGSTTGTKIGTDSAQKLGFWGATPVSKPTVTGSRDGNAALADLLTKLASMGLITNSTS